MKKALFTLLLCCQIFLIGGSFQTNASVKVNSEGSTTANTKGNLKKEEKVKTISSKQLYPGQTVSLKKAVKDISSKVTWESSNKKIATVNSAGKVKAKKAGTVKITAYVKKTKKAICTVTVKKSTISLNKSKATIYTSGTTKVQLKVTVKGKSSKVQWTSSNKKIAVVNSKGKVTAKKTGTATITAKANGVKTTCKITVKKKENAGDKTYKSILVSSDKVSERKIGNIVFSWDAKWKAGSGTYGYIYMTINGKKELLVCKKELEADIITNGSEVYYSAHDYTKDTETIYRINIKDKKETKIFSTHAEDDFSLEGYYGNKLYYIKGFDPGTFCSYSLKTKKETELVNNVQTAKQEKEYFYLYPYQGDWEEYINVTAYNAKTGKTWVEKIKQEKPR